MNRRAVFGMLAAAVALPASVCAEPRRFITLTRTYHARPFVSLAGDRMAIALAEAQILTAAAVGLYERQK